MQSSQEWSPQHDMQKGYRLVHRGPSHTVRRQKTEKTGPMPASGLLGDAVYMFSCQVGAH